MDISFSSYLNPKDLTPNSQEPDTEISIFDAHKYFNGTNDSKDINRQQTSRDSLSVPRLSSVTSVDGCRKNFWTRSFIGTPKTSSEVSWNSQTGLLSNLLRNSRSNKRISAVKKWFFGRKCCCSCKKSVQVKEVNSKSEQRKPVVLINNEKINGSNKANYLHARSDHIMEIHRNKASLLPNNIPNLYQSSQCRISASGKPFIDGPIGFTFPILNPGSDKEIIGKPVIKPPSMDNTIAKPMRKPFADSSMDNPADPGSTIACDDDMAFPTLNPGSDKGIIAKPVIKTPSMDNTIAKAMRKPLADSSMDNRADPGSTSAFDDDMGSDASSDLFEIESFSNQTTVYCRKDSLDEDPAYDARRFASVNGINHNIQCGEKSLDEPPALVASLASTECYPPSEVIPTSGIGEIDFFIRQRVEEAGDSSGKRKLGDNTVVLTSCRQEKAVGLGPQPVKCLAEDPPTFPLHMGGRPPRADKPPQGSASHPTSTRLSFAFAA